MRKTKRDRVCSEGDPRWPCFYLLFSKIFTSTTVVGTASPSTDLNLILQIIYLLRYLGI